MRVLAVLLIAAVIPFASAATTANDPTGDERVWFRVVGQVGVSAACDDPASDITRVVFDSSGPNLVARVDVVDAGRDLTCAGSQLDITRMIATRLEPRVGNTALTLYSFRHTNGLRENCVAMTIGGGGSTFSCVPSNGTAAEWVVPLSGTDANGNPYDLRGHSFLARTQAEAFYTKDNRMVFTVDDATGNSIVTT